MNCEPIHGTRIETGFSPEDYLECRERLIEIGPPEEVERSLARLAVQVALEPSFTNSNHIACARPQPTGRTWLGAIKKVRHTKFGDLEGFNAGDYEIEAVMQDLDEVIWR